MGTTGRGATPSSARRRSRVAIEVAPIAGVVAFAALAVAAVVGPTTAQLSASPGDIGRGLPAVGVLHRSAAGELGADGAAPGEASVMVAPRRASGSRPAVIASGPSSTSLVSFLDGRGRRSSVGVAPGRVRARVPSAGAPPVPAPPVLASEPLVQPPVPVTAAVDPAPAAAAADPLVKPRARGAKQKTSTATASIQSSTSTGGSDKKKADKADRPSTAEAKPAGQSEKGREADPR